MGYRPFRLSALNLLVRTIIKECQVKVICKFQNHNSKTIKLFTFESILKRPLKSTTRTLVQIASVIVLTGVLVDELSAELNRQQGNYI